MRLSHVEKESLYYELAQLARAGVPVSRALETLLEETRGAVRKALERLRREILAGATIPEAFARTEAFSQLELGMISAGDASGRLEQAFRYLSDHFAALQKARGALLRQSLYPIFVLHFGAIVLGLPELVGSGGMPGYLRQVGGFLAWVYGGIIFLAFSIFFLLRAGDYSPAVDRVLRLLPLAGKLRRSSALARFCAAYEMQLSAAVNIVNSLAAAAQASHSALIRRAVRRVTPQLTAGSPLGPLIRRADGFSAPLLRGLRLGEETGRIDEELTRWTTYYREDFFRRLASLSALIPRGLYIVVLCYLGYRLVAQAQGYYSGLEHMLDQ